MKEQLNQLIETAQKQLDAVKMVKNNQGLLKFCIFVLWKQQIFIY